MPETALSQQVVFRKRTDCFMLDRHQVAIELFARGIKPLPELVRQVKLREFFIGICRKLYDDLLQLANPPVVAQLSAP